MKFKVDLSTYKVERVLGDWKDIPGATHNSQHWQLPGHALVEVRMPKTEVLLFHPDTDQGTGHVDVWYYPERWDGEIGVDIRPYIHGVQFKSFTDKDLYSWPTGGWCLLRTIDAIEEFLEKEVDYRPRLRRWIELQFKTHFGSPASEVRPAV